MLRKLNIGEQLALLLIGFTLTVTIFLTASYYLAFEKALRERVMLQLSSVKQLKKVKILEELQEHYDDFQAIIEDTAYFPYTQFEEVILIDSLPKTYENTLLPQIEVFDSSPVVLDLSTRSSTSNIQLMLLGHSKGNYYLGRIHIPEIQQILLERTGLGETGESYLVNKQSQLITKSRFDSLNRKDILVETRGVNQALIGLSGTDIFKDYRGVLVLGAFEKIEFNGLEWVMLSEINHAEAMVPLQQLKNNLFFIFLLIVCFVLIASFFLSRQFVKPLLSMERQLNQLSRGVLAPIAVVNPRKDEIGRMFQALDQLIKTLSDTVIFAQQVGKGNLDFDYQPLSPEDQLGHTLLQMRDQLKSYQEQERRLLQQNQRSLLEGQEKERSRLSKELHDGIGPLLTALKMQVQSQIEDPNIKKAITRALDHTIQEIRQMSNNLMPSVLEDFGAGEAIKNLVEQWKHSTDVKIQFVNDLDPTARREPNIQIMLYRIAQEAIHNAIKHAVCKTVKISLTEFEDRISLFIQDDGVGFDTTRSYDGSGLSNIKERVRLVNGTFELNSSQTGTTLEVEIPTL